MDPDWHDLRTLEGHTVGGVRIGEALGEREARAMRLSDRAEALFVRLDLDGPTRAALDGFEPVDHPGVRPIWEVGLLPGDLGYFVEPSAHGDTLDDSLESGPIAPPRALRIVGELVNALAELHARGIVLQNLRPTVVEVLPGWQGERVRVPGAPWTIGPASGQPLGGYCAPEVAYSDPTPVSDQFSIGVILYELLTGTPPHNPEAPPDERTVVPFLPHPQVPDDVAPLIRRLMEESPSARFPDTAAMGEAIAELQQHHPEREIQKGHYTPVLPPGRASLPERILNTAPLDLPRVEPPPEPVTPATDRVVGSLLLLLSVFFVAAGLYAALFMVF